MSAGARVAPITNEVRTTTVRDANKTQPEEGLDPLSDSRPPITIRDPTPARPASRRCHSSALPIRRSPHVIEPEPPYARVQSARAADASRSRKQLDGSGDASSGR
jgi:hypothetical protein